MLKIHVLTCVISNVSRDPQYNRVYSVFTSYTAKFRCKSGSCCSSVVAPTVAATRDLQTTRTLVFGSSYRHSITNTYGHNRSSHLHVVLTPPKTTKCTSVESASRNAVVDIPVESATMQLREFKKSTTAESTETRTDRHFPA